MTIPVSGTLFATCGGENVDFTGTIHIQHSSTFNDNTLHVEIHQNVHFDGVGETSGQNYIVNAILNENQNVQLEPGVNEFNLINKVAIIGQGNIPNQEFMVLEHFLINANGDLTVNRISFSQSCN